MNRKFPSGYKSFFRPGHQVPCQCSLKQTFSASIFLSGRLGGGKGTRLKAEVKSRPKAWYRPPAERLLYVLEV